MIAVLGCGQHQFCFGEVAGIDVERSVDREIILLPEFCFQVIGKMLRSRHLIGINQLFENPELLEQIWPHGFFIITGFFKRKLVAGQFDRSIFLLHLLKAPVKSFWILTGDGGNKEYRAVTADFSHGYDDSKN